tara:strand:+ start:72594 stop:73061 length:468 start_codon:yes stop_codon:yes gene_type:complete
MNRTALATAFLTVVLATSACSEDIQPELLSVSIEGYESWDKVEPLLGPVPGHGDTYRIMYRNELARSYTGAGDYPIGAAIVKEIYTLSGEDGKGKLSYKAVMRRMDPEDNPGVPIDGGWLFTQIDSGTDEFQRDLCWSSCHRAAPYVGAFFDHAY